MRHTNPDNPSRKDTGIDSIPSIAFEIPKGVTMPSLGDVAAEAGSTNSAQAAVYLLKAMTGITDQDIDLPRAAQAETLAARGESYVRPYAFSGVVEYSDNPLRILQAIETIWNGLIAYEDSKLVLLPGQHLTGNQIRGTITGQHIMEGSRIKTTLAAVDRYNSCRFRLETCYQSDFNGAIQVPEERSETLIARDGQVIVDELQPASYVNEYYQGQQIARTRTRLYASRQPIQIEVPYTTEHNTWRLGEGFRLLLEDSGIDTPKIYRITGKTKKPQKSLVFEAVEQPIQDAWAIGAFTSYLPFSEVAPQPNVLAALPAVVFVDQAAPIGTWYQRHDVQGDSANVIRTSIQVWYETDQRENMVIEGRWRTVEADGTTGQWNPSGQSFAASEGIAWIHFVDPLKPVQIQMRFRDDDGQNGPWSPEMPQTVAVVRTVPMPPDLANAWSVPALLSAFLYWPVPPEDFRPFLKHTFVEWGTVADDGTFTQIGTINDPNNAHTIPDLMSGTTYRARLAYVNTEDVQGNLFVHDFTTRAPVETTGVRFNVPAASANFVEGDTVNLQLPAAVGADNITYTIEGTLPGGLAFAAATRRIAGDIAQRAAGSYQVILRAVNDDDANDMAAIPVNLTVTASALGAPGAIGNLAIVDDETEDDRIGLDWDAPTSGGPIGGYEIQYREVE